MYEQVLEHLREDSKTWKTLSDQAQNEYESDLILISKIEKAMGHE
jgi:hypothetical protein